MGSPNGQSQRRSLKYIRLAAFLAGQPTGVDRVEMTLPEVEELVGETLPAALGSRRGGATTSGGCTAAPG